MYPSLLPLLSLLLACVGGWEDPTRELAAPVADGPMLAVEIHSPPTLGVVDTTLEDVNGLPIGVSCGTCHGAPGDSDAFATAEGNPEAMHEQVVVVHGKQACDACHDADRRYLHLADGSRLAMEDALSLCGQCHGPQLRDYKHGAHGGMSGSWDLRRGRRLRNHCVDCHDPHAPAWSPVDPVHPPRDRGLEVH